MKTPAKRRTGEVTASNVSTEKTWCTGESPYTGESITSESAYRIQTFNTTNLYTGESAYTGESITMNRRIRFQRSTNRLAHRRISVQQANRLPLIGVSDSNVQHNRLVHRRIGVHKRIDYHKSAYQIPTFNQQIGTPANQRTQANRLPLIGVSDSNVQHNRLVHRRIGVHRRIDYHKSAYQIPTFNQQIGTPANQRTQANRLPLIGVSDSNVQHNRLVHRRIGVHRRIDYH